MELKHSDQWESIVDLMTGRVLNRLGAARRFARPLGVPQVGCNLSSACRVKACVGDLVVCAQESEQQTKRFGRGNR